MQTGEGQNAITKGRPRKELQARRLRGIARALYSGSHVQESKPLLTPPPPHTPHTLDLTACSACPNREETLHRATAAGVY